MIKKRKLIYWVGGLIPLLFLSMLVSITIGSVALPTETVLKVLISKLSLFPIEKTWTQSLETIVWNLRFPRIILAVVIGAMLSVSGVAFQGVLRNPLADPYILGVSSGAALGAASTLVFLPASIGSDPFAMPLIAFVGAILSLWFVMKLATNKNHAYMQNETLILAGVIVQSLAGAVLSFLIAISGKKMQSIIFWMMGSLANKDWLDTLILIPYFMFGMIYLMVQYRELDIFSLGERAAFHLGIEVEKKKVRILVVAALLASTAVSVVGVIGFVGLIIPHMIRLLIGPNHRALIPVSAIAGAIFLLWADTLARTVIPSREIPIGVITAFVGAPFFAYLLKKGEGRQEV